MENKMKSRGKQRRNEWVLLGIVALAAVLYFIWRVFVPAEEGAVVVVQSHSEEYARLPLDKDAELDIKWGDSHNYLVIRDGVATVTDASCPDKLCVHQADISKGGEMIVCLPNQVMITVEGSGDSEVDSVAQ